MHVLVADDDQISRRLLEAMLTRWGYEAVTVCDGQEALEAMLAPDGPRLAILDWMMPRMDGVEVCRRLRERQDPEHYAYLILLTARDQTKDFIAGLEGGADDYIRKPFQPDELRARLRAAQRILDLHWQLAATREALLEQATHDSLTGLLNRGAVMNLLQKELARAEREKTPIGLMMADLDHFKRVNDTFGHAAGDAVLVEVAARIGGSLRSYDMVSRYGGEEFLFVLPGCGADEVADRGQQVREAIRARPVLLQGRQTDVFASIGVTAYEPHREAIGADCLIALADEALYDAKRSGRDCVRSAGIVAAGTGLVGA